MVFDLARLAAERGRLTLVVTCWNIRRIANQHPEAPTDDPDQSKRRVASAGIAGDSSPVGEVAVRHIPSAGDVVPAPPTATPSAPTEPKLIISSRLIAVGSLIFGVACLTALVIVAARSDAEALATTALSLAVIAFAAQLLASAAQTHFTNQQSARSEQLNSETQKLLTEMQTTARGTEQMVRDQFGQLLGAFMDAANTTGRGKEFDPEEFERRLMSNIRATSAAVASPSPTPQPSSPRPTRRPRRVPPPTFPTREEVEPILDDLQSLSQPARGRLASFAIDQARFDEGQLTYAGFQPDANDEELKDRGFIHLIRLPEDQGGSLVHQVTDRGRLAGTVLRATGPVPEWAEPIVAGLVLPDDEIPF